MTNIYSSIHEQADAVLSALGLLYSTLRNTQNPDDDTDRRRIRSCLATTHHMLLHASNLSRVLHCLGHKPRDRYFNIVDGQVQEVSLTDYIDPEADGVQAENATPPVFTPEGPTGIVI